MKKFCFFLLSVAAFSSIFGQHPLVGVQLGLNVSTLRGKNSYHMKSRSGIYAGTLLSLEKDPFVLRLGIIYSEEGAKYLIGNAEHTLYLNSIKVPLQSQYRVYKNFFVEAGPELDFLIHVRDEVGGNETGFFTPQDFKTVGLSMTTGIRYLGNSGWGLDGCYNFSINNVDNGGINTFRNYVFKIGLVYIFQNSARKKH